MILETSYLPRRLEFLKLEAPQARNFLAAALPLAQVAGCISKCHGSAGESQAAGGGSRPSDMFPLRPRQPLARNVRPGVVPGSAKGGHCLRAQSRRWRQLTLLVEVW